MNNYKPNFNSVRRKGSAHVEHRIRNFRLGYDGEFKLKLERSQVKGNAGGGTRISGRTTHAHVAK